MLYSKCPTCGHSLAEYQVPYETKEKLIKDNPALTITEKQKQVAELIKNFELRYCCNSRVMSYIRNVELIL